MELPAEDPEEHDLYFEDGWEDLIDNDELCPEEAAFMKGYDDAI